MSTLNIKVYSLGTENRLDPYLKLNSKKSTLC